MMGLQGKPDKGQFLFKSKLSKSIQCCHNNCGIVKLFFKRLVRKNNIGQHLKYQVCGVGGGKKVQEGENICIPLAD